MDLPDCPPGAEGYQDSVTEVPKKLDLEDSTCTKAELEFQEHLNSLKIKLEDGTTRCMVERRGRDISGKWIYLCFPCAAVCSGESILQTHISGKKHKNKLTMRNVWAKSIFDEHPLVQSASKTAATEKVLQKMAEEVDLHNRNPSELDLLYNKYRNATCHIQDSINAVKTPLIGVEYLVEHPPEEAHYEPSYICTLCFKQGHPRTIINHMTCFWHRYRYLVHHFPKAGALLTPYRVHPKYREGVNIIMNRLAQRIVDKYGVKRPVNIDREEYEKDKERIHQWIYKGHHFSEKDGPTFEEVVDVGLIDSLHQSNVDSQAHAISLHKEPSPPVVAAPSRPRFNSFSRVPGRQERRGVSIESLSDISDDDQLARREPAKTDARSKRSPAHKPRYEPYPAPHETSPFRSRFALRNTTGKRTSQEKADMRYQIRAPNTEYKVKLAEEKRRAAVESANKSLAYHEKNPEKHPMYPDEWKKFWNRRYKEIQAAGKDPSKHDFKPEWIQFWTGRVKELHDEELRVQVNEIYRRMCLPPPDSARRSPDKPDFKKLSPRRKSPEPRRRTPEPRRRSPEPRRRSPEPRRRSPEPRRRSPEPRRRSPELRRRSPEPRRRSPIPRRRTPDYRRDRRSQERRRSPPRRRSPVPPLRELPARSRSPMRRRSPARTHISLESRGAGGAGGPGGAGGAGGRGSRSPLSQRAAQPRNRSPEPRQPAHPPPSLQTVLISDDELKPDDGLSPWNSDNDLDSMGSLPEVRSYAGSTVSRNSRVRRDTRDSRDTRDPRDLRDVRDSRNARDARELREARGPNPQELGPPENVVATLRLLVALEDYLGSLGPKVVDLLTEALKMEKDEANSSEELLVRESALVMLETAKEKLKGAVQAGLVPAAAAAAARAAVVRVAATLHAADTRSRRQHQQSNAANKPAAVPVVGVGEVDRAQIAKQMAEALIAQGKTDVSSEELAQLVEAVVGMAEAKKREAEKKKAAVKPPVEQPKPPVVKMSGTASALQMLQSAYDENDKKIDKEDAPDAMDGLSDSDLETLLKNFNELSAEEQHSLIAYLKKLEAKEPVRVERLRKYVSDAASNTPQPEEEAKETVEDVQPVLVESDDDDYAVEEVFKSATQKVKEDQIRQEMEIVKKSIEESKAAPAPEKAAAANPAADNPVANKLTSATGLFALVQASLKSTPAPTAAPDAPASDVVASHTQPRSFGDLPDSPNFELNPSPKPHIQNIPIGAAQLVPQLGSFHNQQQGSRTPQNQGNFENRNMPNEQYNQEKTHFNPGNEQYPQGNNYNQGNANYNPGSENFIPGSDNFNQGNPNYNEGTDNFNQGNSNFNQGKSNYNQGVDNFNQGNPNYNEGTDNFNQGNSNYNQGKSNFNQGVDNFNQGKPNFIQGTDNFNQGNSNYNEGTLGNPSYSGKPNYNQGIDNFQGKPNYNQGTDNFNQGNPNYNQGTDNFNQGNPNYNQETDNFNSGNPNYNQGNNNYNQGNDNYNQGPWNPVPNNTMDQRGPPIRGRNTDTYAPNSYNQGARGNFNNRGNNNYNVRPQNMNQQFGNYDKPSNNNFRGRGRGHFGGNPRGRGRGYY